MTFLFCSGSLPLLLHPFFTTWVLLCFGKKEKSYVYCTLLRLSHLNTKCQESLLPKLVQKPGWSWRVVKYKLCQTIYVSFTSLKLGMTSLPVNWKKRTRFVEFDCVCRFMVSIYCLGKLGTFWLIMKNGKI